MEEEIKISNRSIISILKDLQRYDFPQNIVVRASQIFLSVPTNRRKNNRRLLIYRSVYEAYLEAGYRKNIHLLAAQMGIDKRKIGKSSAILEESGYQLPSMDKVHVIDLIPDICNHVGITELTMHEIQRRTEQIMKKDKELRSSGKSEWLKERQMYCLAVAFVSYYAISSGLELEIEKLAECCNKSKGTIIGVRKLIERVDNSCINST